MVDYNDLESVVDELLQTFEVDSPPVPVETMLQKPPPGLWSEVDVTQLSGSFLRLDDVYSPRMSMARLLARHITHSDWGAQYGIDSLRDDDEEVRLFARMLLMPRSMIQPLSAGARNPAAMRLHFEVPEVDASQRLVDLSSYE